MSFDNDEQQPKVAPDVNEQEFERFLEEMDIDGDKTHMDDEDRAGFDSAKRQMLRAMEKGSLVINDNGEPMFTPDDNNGEIIFHEPTGATYMEMDKKKKGHDMSKMFAIMAAQTKETPARFSNMKNRDLKVCQAITTLFLG